MSLSLAKLMANHTGKKLTRQACLGLQASPVYNDGRTKQTYADECNINKIMARADAGATISHLAKHQGTYSDFSDYDFLENTRKMTQGREIFDDLPAEIRTEFKQSPAAFFAYVNDPKNVKDLNEKLPGLAQPGRQLPPLTPPSADLASAEAAKQSPAVEPPKTPQTPPAPAEAL